MGLFENLQERKLRRCPYYKPRPDTVSWCELDESVCRVEQGDYDCEEWIQMQTEKQEPISISGGIPEGEMPESVTTTGKADYFEQPSNYTFNEVANLVEEGRMTGRREVVGWTRNNGYLINGHTPGELKKLEAQLEKWGL